MLFSPAHQERCYAFAARPGPWILAGVFITSAVWWVTGSPIPAFATGVFIFVLWCLSRELMSLRNHLTIARRDRAVLEEALRQSQKLEAIGRLTAGIAHDFNNHLTVISSNLELMTHRLDGGRERLIRHADAAMQGVQRAAFLTGRLLSFSRQRTPEPEAVDVGRLLSGLSDLLRRTLEEGVELEVRLSDAQLFVWADVHQMENALLSLAVNARSRISHGGMLALTVGTVCLDEGFVAAHPGVLPGDHVRVTVNPTTSPAVADGQPALDAASPWRSADDLASVGLSMAGGFVREAGGCLLQSGALAGAPSLCLLLPRYQPPSPAGARRDGREGRPRILVVEDDSAVRGACGETLRELGYEVLEAPDAMEAFRLIADHGGIDLLLTDLRLPGGVSGRALAAAARNVDPAMQVLFITGYASGDLNERSDDALLAKPFSPTQLARKVRRMLGTQVANGRTETV
jgi:CheY-like chemotaxis protein